MHGPGEHYASEIRQLEKDKHHMISLICGIEWTNWTNRQNRDRLIDRGQEDSSGGENWGDGRIEQKQKELMDPDNSVVIAGWVGGVGGGGREYKGDKW